MTCAEAAKELVDFVERAQGRPMPLRVAEEWAKSFLQCDDFPKPEKFEFESSFGELETAGGYLIYLKEYRLPSMKSTIVGRRWKITAEEVK